jgi:hypothetical protein
VFLVTEVLAECVDHLQEVNLLASIPGKFVLKTHSAETNLLKKIINFVQLVDFM